MSLPLNKRAHRHFPTGRESDLSQVTHLGVVAHQDDLEFMAASAILECKENPEKNFLGVVCTDGRSSSRSGAFAKMSDQEMVEQRQKEQVRASEIGKYFGVIQLGYQSKELKSDSLSARALVTDLKMLIEASQAEVVYTHNPFDKHLTHLTVCQLVVESLQKSDVKPKSFYGAEVWRSLDWLPECLKQRVSLEGQEGFLKELMATFVSQIEGGKNYSHAVLGRKASNATFKESHSVDQTEYEEIFLEMNELLADGVSLSAFCASILQSFEKEIYANLKGALQWK